MRLNVFFEITAWDQYQYWLENDKQMFRKLNQLIKECKRSAFEGLGKPELLKNEYSGYWSRRIDKEHRLVYKVEFDTLIIIQCRFHYDK